MSLALVALGVAIVVALARTAPETARTGRTEQPPRVLVMAASPVPVQRQWRGYGTARAFDSSDVPARVTATVVDVPLEIRAGARVRKGQLLVQLDDSDFRRNLEMVKQEIAEVDAQLELLDVEQRRLTERLALEGEDLKLAQQEWERLHRMVGEGAANQQELDAVRRTVIAVQRAQSLTAEALGKLAPRRLQLQAQRARFTAAQQQAQQNVERARITSPIAGILQAVDVQEGENVAAGSRVARVIDPAVIEVPLQLPASARADIEVGDSVSLHSSAKRPITWKAQVARLAPVDDVETRTTTVYVLVRQEATLPLAGELASTETSSPNGNRRLPADTLAPGMFVSGAASGRQVQQRWIVPRRAVQGERIRVIQDGIILSHPVTVDFHIEGRQPDLGVDDDQWAVLAEPLSEGQQVVLNGSIALLDGTRVEPILARQTSPPTTQHSRATTHHSSRIIDHSALNTQHSALTYHSSLITHHSPQPSGAEP